MKILFADKNIIVCIKPYGIDSEKEMPDQIRSELNVPDAYIGVVHRLDITTSGVMVYARNKTICADLTKQIQEHSFHKTYLCVAQNPFMEHSGSMKDFLFKDRNRNKVYIADKPRKGTREAILDYEVVSSLIYKEQVINLCKVDLYTGRTHQIRVQFASRKHPLCGDGKYGSKLNGEIALWCCSICFCYNDQIRTFESYDTSNAFIKLFRECL